MLRELITKLFKKPQEDDFEYMEMVQHDTVMEMVDGKLVEVTSDDSETGK